jgi:hypothetical protein
MEEILITPVIFFGVIGRNFNLTKPWLDGLEPRIKNHFKRALASPFKKDRFTSIWENLDEVLPGGAI